MVSSRHRRLGHVNAPIAHLSDVSLRIPSNTGLPMHWICLADQHRMNSNLSSARRHTMPWHRWLLYHWLWRWQCEVPSNQDHRHKVRPTAFSQKPTPDLSLTEPESLRLGKSVPSGATFLTAMKCMKELLVFLLRSRDDKPRLHSRLSSSNQFDWLRLRLTTQWKPHLLGRWHSVGWS